MSFTYTCISAACGLVAVLSGLFLYANFGRRPILITGAFLQIPFMCIVAGIGGGRRPTEAGTHAVIASIILFSCVEKVSLSTACYIITSEIGGTKMRKKSTSLVIRRRLGLTLSHVVGHLMGCLGSIYGHILHSLPPRHSRCQSWSQGGVDLCRHLDSLLPIRPLLCS